MFRRKNTILGLDIGTSSIKAIEMSSSGGSGDFSITGYGQVAITDVENPLNDIKELLHTSGIKSKRVITGVSGREVIVRYISMQPVDKENLAEAVRFEADKYIPYDLEEVVLDSQRLDDDTTVNVSTSGEMKVLLVAAKRSLIESRVGLLRSSELHPSIIDVDSFALGNAFVLKSMLSPRPEVEGKIVSLVDIGCTKTNINIMIGNTSFFTREIYLAGNEFTEEIQKRLEVTTEEAEGLKREPGIFALEVQEAVAPVIEDLANEITLSFEYFEGQFEREVEEIFVSGGGSQLFSLEPDFERIFGKRINRWDPTENFEIREDQVDIDALRANSSQLAIAIGLASRIYQNKV
ncbi:type IV pilus assembly protein PilM [Candidatus Uabimicrobium amorphum]|uniref:Pilus assembly protein PilM n=1 Tax=Uabimicrobium amorphum TaxID=2596890 RepID=A0A5S9F6W4_UABAM|nr:type IV pilus assembly protein PilM [Candidatus Uabimicrobium amorphum]BBM87633.1 pilus assembly protein PilM [Candidatus Uabimicrobium amorphum]